MKKSKKKASRRLRPVLMVIVVGLIGAGSLLASGAEGLVNPPSFTVQIINNAGVPHEQVEEFKEAVILQSHQLRNHWHTPILRFASKGRWRLVLQTPIVTHYTERYQIGFHTYESYTYVGVPHIPWTVIASHELMESLTTREIGDPVEGRWYKLNGVFMADFVYPSFYNKDGDAPFDHMHLVMHPHQYAGVNPVHIANGLVPGY